MTEQEQTPDLSPLAQSITRDGKTVRVDIYEDGEGGWFLEVVDEHGNSTAWDASFASDREALDEALKTIDEDGIDSLIGSPEGTQKAKDLNQPLSRAELNELDEFLADESIDAAELDRLAGLVERVTFHNEQNGFCVLRLKVKGERELITLIGHAPVVSPGEYASASGNWVTDREHGRQFRAVFVKISPPTTLTGIERYLGSGMVKGIGPSMPASW
jgi:hypothetical protein